MTGLARTVVAAIALAAAVAIAYRTVPVPALGAQEPTTTTVAVDPVPVPPIIPEPGSGTEPESATDRGGWAQYAVLGGIVVALGGIVLLIRRDARRSDGAGEDA